MQEPIKYIHELGELFEDVQLANVFPDNKTFPDCTPKGINNQESLQEIKIRYAEQKNLSDFDLTTFVLNNFDLPHGHETSYISDKSESAKEHIEELWSVLTREPHNEKSSLIPLPNPYIVPGGRFGEVYYWDSYFTMLGLQESGKTEMIQAMVDNFSYLIYKVGHIPNANRIYYIGRSQPPFYALMLKLLSEEKGPQVLKDYLPYMEKEHEFWTEGKRLLKGETTAVKRVVKMPDGSVLNRYWDNYCTPRPEAFKEDFELAQHSEQKPEELYRHLRAAAESGWDFSSRWFKNPDAFHSIHTTDIIPVDLNCLLVFLEETIAEVYASQKSTITAKRYKTLAQNRREAIQKYCWNEEKGFYFDFDFIQKKQKEIETLAATFPLFFSIATAEQAKSVAEILEEKFLKTGGLLTTLAFTGQQWDAPNGWAPLQWIAYKGLKNYGLNELADKIKSRWVDLNLKVYKETGKMTEKYNVYDDNLEAGGGEYPNQDGFGWTNGVLLKMMNE
ncbi:alpha,alpha-trehalase TreF [Emticicia agri]|uniref:Alpha,alpha-trehalase TreF n=1 Tax=Emticicia agri TaxID=2492393 RepID=A0A4Q5M1T3_9BACT|nr:alpha,alpha-trehalase TreF [Emticicia agri]RYU96182.1 alpha,alpha-trehalase TreF [Emticicia agri]